MEERALHLSCGPFPSSQKIPSSLLSSRSADQLWPVCIPVVLPFGEYHINELMYYEFSWVCFSSFAYWGIFSCCCMCQYFLFFLLWNNSPLNEYAKICPFIIWRAIKLFLVWGLRIKKKKKKMFGYSPEIFVWPYVFTVSKVGLLGGMVNVFFSL